MRKRGIEIDKRGGEREIEKDRERQKDREREKKGMEIKLKREIRRQTLF